MTGIKSQLRKLISFFEGPNRAIGIILFPRQFMKRNRTKRSSPDVILELTVRYYNKFNWWS